MTLRRISVVTVLVLLVTIFVTNLIVSTRLPVSLSKVSARTEMLTTLQVKNFPVMWEHYKSTYLSTSTATVYELLQTGSARAGVSLVAVNVGEAPAFGVLKQHVWEVLLSAESDLAGGTAMLVQYLKDNLPTVIINGLDTDLTGNVSQLNFTVPSVFVG